MSPRARSALPAAAFAAAMVAFALASRAQALMPLRAASLILAAAALAMGTWRGRRPAALFGLRPLPRRRLPLLLGAVAVGAALAVAHRLARGAAPLPTDLTWFALSAGGIGLCEELAYRGFVQGCLRGYGALAAALAAAGAHAAYKCGLFLAPGAVQRPDFLLLGGLTFVVGAGFGLARERLGGVAWPAAAHVVFDIISYGDLARAPWWVALP